MAIENPRESARLASSRLALSSNNSQQSSQRLGQALPIYTRPDAGRSSSPHHYENIQSSYNGNRQEPIYENLRGSMYANAPELAPPLPPRAWVGPNRSNNIRAGVYPSAVGQGGYARPGLGDLPVNNPIGQAGYPIGSYGASNISVSERVRQYEQNLIAPEHGLRQGNPAPPNAQPTVGNRIAGNAAAVQSNSAIAQATQRFGNAQPIQAYSNMQPAESHVNAQQGQYYDPQQGRNYGSQQSRNYGSQQGQFYDPQQGRNYGSQENRNHDLPQTQFYDPQQGRNYGSQQSRNYGSQQGQFYDPQQGRNYGSQEGQNYSLQQSRNYGSQQVQNYGSQESQNYELPRAQYYEPQQGRNYGAQQSWNHGSQQGQNYTSRPFSSPGELASYEAEVERLLSHPNRREISVPYGMSMGVFTTPAGSGIEFGRMQPGTTEFNQFPVGISSFGPSPYGSQNAQQVMPNQAQGDLPVIIRL